MISCPCCSGLLLPHIRRSGLRWFCRHCWEDMPVFPVSTPVYLSDLITEKLSCSLQNSEPTNTLSYTKPIQARGWRELRDVSA